MTEGEAFIVLKAVADAPSDLDLDVLVDELAVQLPEIEWRRLLAMVTEGT